MAFDARRDHLARGRAAEAAASAFVEAVQEAEVNTEAARRIGRAATDVASAPGAEELVEEALGRDLTREVGALSEAYGVLASTTDGPERQEFERQKREVEAAEGDLDRLEQRLSELVPARLTVVDRFDETLGGDGMYEALDLRSMTRVVLVAPDTDLLGWPQRRAHLLYVRPAGETAVTVGSVYGGGSQTEYYPKFVSEGSVAAVRQTREEARESLKQAKRNLRSVELEVESGTWAAEQRYLKTASPSLQALREAVGQD